MCGVVCGIIAEVVGDECEFKEFNADVAWELLAFEGFDSGLPVSVVL